METPRLYHRCHLSPPAGPANFCVLLLKGALVCSSGRLPSPETDQQHADGSRRQGPRKSPEWHVAVLTTQEIALFLLSLSLSRSQSSLLFGWGVALPGIFGKGHFYNDACPKMPLNIPRPPRKPTE